MSYRETDTTQNRATGSGGGSRAIAQYTARKDGESTNQCPKHLQRLCVRLPWMTEHASIDPERSTIWATPNDIMIIGKCTQGHNTLNNQFCEVMIDENDDVHIVKRNINYVQADERPEGYNYADAEKKNWNSLTYRGG